MHTDLLSLWLPIIASAAGVFFASFILWAATPWHNADIRKVPDPGAADRAVEGLALRPGFYMLPCTHDPQEMKGEEFQARFKRGPWATINVFPSQPNMGKNLGLSFATYLVISVVIAYLASSVLAPGTAYPKVFQVVGTAGVLAYTFGGIANGVWFGKPTGWVVRDIIDAAVYAMVTAGMFAWLWPSGPALPGV